MVANGRERGKEYCVDAIRDRWAALLEDEVAPALALRDATLASRRLWHLRAMAAQKTMSRVHRVRIAYERWNVRHPAGPLVSLERPSGQRAVDDLADVSREPLGAD